MAPGEAVASHHDSESEYEAKLQEKRLETLDVETLVALKCERRRSP